MQGSIDVIFIFVKICRMTTLTSAPYCSNKHMACKFFCLAAWCNGKSSSSSLYKSGATPERSKMSRYVIGHSLSHAINKRVLPSSLSSSDSIHLFNGWSLDKSLFEEECWQAAPSWTISVKRVTLPSFKAFNAVSCN